jgi:hypothetical protein
MEVPSLGSCTIWYLDDNVPTVNKINVSIFWQLRNNVEISFNVKTELLVKFTLSWFSFPFISIDNVPLLVNSAVFSIDLNVSIFSINCTLNIQYLSFLIDDEGILVFEELPPS